MSWVTTVTLLLEIVIIDLQAWRGTTSHFNVGTVLDGVLFTIMGIAILVQTLAAIAVAVALWRQHFSDRAIGWALRLGMTITIVGAMTGGLMTQPTRAQLDDARAGNRMTVSGAHTVGAPDGGPGLPGTGWSREHGDLRVAHFLGLHALQILALAAFFSPGEAGRTSVGSGWCGPSLRATFRCSLCCCGRRCADSRSSRQMRRR